MKQLCARKIVANNICFGLIFIKFVQMKYMCAMCMILKVTKISSIELTSRDYA